MICEHISFWSQSQVDHFVIITVSYKQAAAKI